MFMAMKLVKQSRRYRLLGDGQYKWFLHLYLSLIELLGLVLMISSAAVICFQIGHQEASFLIKSRKSIELNSAQISKIQFSPEPNMKRD